MPDIEIYTEVIEGWLLDPDSPVGAALEENASEVEAVAKILASLPGTGRFYPAGEYFLVRYRPERKVYHWIRTTDHTASAPDEPPAPDSGFLVGNIGHKVEVGEEGTLVGKVTANTDYAMFVETGTIYMAPRPFLRPALSSVLG